MKDEIEQIRENLRAGRYLSEAAVSQGVVQRLLKALGWPIYNTDVVVPEYSLEGRRVDYPLCHPARKPLIFIEVKQVGQAEGADRQLFEYAFHVGIPMAILTDGREWQFFLPGEQGDYSERRVYTMDLLERDPDEIVARFRRYLAYDAVRIGEAIDAARSDYRDIARKREAKSRLPEAWRKLVASQEGILIDLLADTVAGHCGYKPDPDTEATFLSTGLQLSGTYDHPSNTVPGILGRSQPGSSSTESKRARKNDQTGFVGYILMGQERPADGAYDALVKALGELADRGPWFLERFAALPKHGRLRRYVAARKQDLYPERPDLAEQQSKEFRPGWWVGTNVGWQGVERILEMASEVAGLQYGIDLRVSAPRV